MICGWGEGLLLILICCILFSFGGKKFSPFILISCWLVFMFGVLTQRFAYFFKFYKCAIISEKLQECFYVVDIMIISAINWQLKGLSEEDSRGL